MGVYKRGIGDNNVSHAPKKFVTLYASAACTEGSFVSIDTGDSTNGLGYSVRDAEVGPGSTAHNVKTFGVATQTVAAGEDVIVQIAGKYENANVDGSTIAGTPLAGPLSGGTVGQAGILLETTFGNVVAVALEADTTNLADVMIVNQGFFD